MSWAFSPLLTGAGITAAPVAKDTGWLSPSSVTNSPGTAWDLPYNAETMDGGVAFTFTNAEKAYLVSPVTDLGIPQNSLGILKTLVVRVRGMGRKASAELPIESTAKVVVLNGSNQVIATLGETLLPSLLGSYLNFSITELQLRTAINPSSPGSVVLDGTTIASWKIGVNFGGPLNNTRVDIDHIQLGATWDDYSVDSTAPPPAGITVPLLTVAQSVADVTVVSKLREFIAVPSLAFNQSISVPLVRATDKIAIQTLAVNQTISVPAFKATETIAVQSLSFNQSLTVPALGNFLTKGPQAPATVFTGIAQGPTLEDWISPNNVRVLDGNVAYVQVNKSYKVPYLAMNLSELGLPISPDVKVQSIQVTLVARHNNNTSPVTVNTRIFSGNTFATAIGTQVDYSGLTTSLATHNVPASNYGLTATQLQSNNLTNYKIGISASEANFGNTFYVDQFVVKVTYIDDRILENAIIVTPTLSITATVQMPSLNERRKELIPTLPVVQSRPMVTINNNERVAVPVRAFTQTIPNFIVFGNESIEIPSLAITQTLNYASAPDIIRVNALEMSQTVNEVKANDKIRLSTLSFNQTLNQANGNSKTTINVQTVSVQEFINQLKVNDRVNVPTNVFIQVIGSAYSGLAVSVPPLTVQQNIANVLQKEVLHMPTLDFSQTLWANKVSERIHVGPLAIDQVIYNVGLAEGVVVPPINFNQDYGSIKISDLIAPITLAINQELIAPRIFIDFVPLWKFTASWSNYVQGPDGKYALQHFYTETDEIWLTGISKAKLEDPPIVVGYLEEVKDA